MSNCLHSFVRFVHLPCELMLSAQIWIKHPFISAAVHHDGSETTEGGRGEEGTRGYLEIRKEVSRVGVQMDGAGRAGRRRGKLIKTEARLMFVGGILIRSRGDTTPSSLLPFLAPHLWVSLSKP